jgi:hypothetical protein
MKSSRLKNIILSFLMIACISCKKTSNTNSISCEASLAAIGSPSSDQQVEYSASVSGTGGTRISSIAYQDSAGITTIKNPAIPWTKYVNLKKGEGISVTADGNAFPGDTILVFSYADGTISNATCP